MYNSVNIIFFCYYLLLDAQAALIDLTTGCGCCGASKKRRPGLAQSTTPQRVRYYSSATSSTRSSSYFHICILCANYI